MLEVSGVITYQMVQNASCDNRLRGELSMLRGEVNEIRFIKAWEPKKIGGIPGYKWLKEVVPATRKEDTLGIDAVMHTNIMDLERINIQVKSGTHSANSFRKRHPDIPVAVILDHYQPSDIRKITILELMGMFPRFLEFIKGMKLS